MKTEGNPNTSGVETSVKTLVDNTLSKIIEVAKTASEAIGAAGDLLGNVAVYIFPAGVKGDGVQSLVKGIKSIVDVKGKC
ncbi:hypothetical protein BOM_1354 (plasmid) [Borrelia miyamotoi FR64b]|uniref:Variable large protein n=1 Tax=Borrelia miyamotoi FR64b TaxID=1292392 RepID=W5SG73_9SPIR|nr:hypothetical protein BOM_1354 [Borrelia miyamotoi FR64b]